MPAKKKTRNKKKTLKKSSKPSLKKKPSSLKTAKTKAKKQPVTKLKENIVIGKVTHYFPNVNAAAVKLKTNLKVGDTIRIKGHTTDFSETISSMQIERTPVKQAKKGQEIGLLVPSRVRRKDIVYKVKAA